jgi:hypothetical protein
MIDKHLKEIERLGKADLKRGDEFRSLAFITEEVGEIAMDLVDGDKAHGKLECVDVAVSALGLYFALGGSKEELDKRINRQLKKWAKHL